MKNHIEIIPEEILKADIIAGDLNNMETNLEKNGIYQTKSIGHLKEKVKQPKGTSDHYILIYETTLPIEISQSEKTIKILDQTKIQSNWNNLKDLVYGKTETLSLPKPHKTIKIKSREMTNNYLEYYEDFENITKKSRKI